MFPPGPRRQLSAPAHLPRSPPPARRRPRCPGSPGCMCRSPLLYIRRPRCGPWFPGRMSRTPLRAGRRLRSPACSGPLCPSPYALRRTQCPACSGRGCWSPPRPRCPPSLGHTLGRPPRRSRDRPLCPRAFRSSAMFLRSSAVPWHRHRSANPGSRSCRLPAAPATTRARPPACRPPTSSPDRRSPRPFRHPPSKGPGKSYRGLPTSPSRNP